MSNYQTRELTTPKIIVDGIVIPVVPGSVVVRVPGEAEVRAMSTGGGGVQAVVGVKAESLLGHVKFDLPNTAQNADRVRLWKANLIAGVPSTINAVEDGIQFPHQNMFCTKDTELPFKSSSAISCEWFGEYQA